MGRLNVLLQAEIDDEAPIDEPEWLEDFCEALDALTLEDELELVAIAAQVKTTVDAMEFRDDQVEVKATAESRHRLAVTAFLDAPKVCLERIRASPSAFETEGALGADLMEHRRNARMATMRRRIKCSV